VKVFSRIVNANSRNDFRPQSELGRRRKNVCKLIFEGTERETG
jgi:hypothetical protein